MPPLSQFSWPVAWWSSLLSLYPLLLAYFRLYCLCSFGWLTLLFWVQYICFLLRRFYLFLLKFQWYLCNSSINLPACGTKTKAEYKGVGRTHTGKGPPEPLVEVQEATPSSHVAQTRPELRIGPDAKQPQKLPSFSRSCCTVPSDSSWQHLNYALSGAT